MPPGNRDVGCVVTLEDGTWGFGFTDHGRVTAAMIEDFLAPMVVGRDVFSTETTYDLMVRACSGLRLKLAGRICHSSRGLGVVGCQG